MTEGKELVTLIIQILEARPESRNSDMNLATHTWYTLLPGYFAKRHDENGLPDALYSLTTDDIEALDRLIPLKSIERARRKITGHGKTDLKRFDLLATDPKVRKARRIREQDYILHMSTPQWQQYV